MLGGLVAGIQHEVVNLKKIVSLSLWKEATRIRRNYWCVIKELTFLTGRITGEIYSSKTLLKSARVTIYIFLCTFAVRDSYLYVEIQAVFPRYTMSIIVIQSRTLWWNPLSILRNGSWQIYRHPTQHLDVVVKFGQRVRIQNSKIRQK